MENPTTAPESIEEINLKWTGGWNSEPVWPCEPDLDTVKVIAKTHLQEQLPENLNDSLLDVSFFAQGGFNKLYQISYAGHQTSYLLRVTLPVVPYHKTESEVATLAYLRATTSIPLPRVLAWSSSSNNQLNFEWILMEKLSGVTLYDVWRDLAWDCKLEITTTMAIFVKQLQDDKFDRIGGLHFVSALDQEADASTKLAASIGNLIMDESADDEIDKDHGEVGSSVEVIVEPLDEDTNIKAGDLAEHASFTIGPIFEPLFFMSNRLKLPGDRGPYCSSLDWLRASIEIQIAWIENGHTQDDEDYTSDIEEEAPIMQAVCQDYLENLSTTFDPYDETRHPSFSLHHHDLNAHNILIDPQTFKITGIVDWELINTVPDWLATDHPKFLQFMREPEDEDELKFLRNHYDAEMEKLGGMIVNGTPEEKMRLKAKKDCYRYLPELTGMWQWPKKWLHTWRKSGVSMNHDEWATQTLGEGDSDEEF